MTKTIFDSKAEQRIYRRLKSLWSRYVEIYPHIPIRNALGYGTLKRLPLKQKTKDYLLRTEFDFVVCDSETGVSRLAIEFDGIGHGFSRDGEYVSRVSPLNDPYRKLKLDAKLQACELTGLPVVVVSFPETGLLRESKSAITVLDAIIGEVRAAIGLRELISSHTETFTKAFSEDPSGDAAESVMLALEFQSDLENNPIRKKTRELFLKLPLDSGYMEPLRDRQGYVGMRRAIVGGTEGSMGGVRHQILLSTSVYVRDLSCIGCDAINLADCIAEYCLARKALHEIGTDPSVWQKLLDKTPWTEA